MSTGKKKGDFNGASGKSGDIGGNKKARMKPDQNSRTAHKQNAGGTGGANVGKDG